MGIVQQNAWNPYFSNCMEDGGNPILLISEDKLKNVARQFTANFPGWVSYAVKANSNKRVIELLYQAGIHAFDVASIEEMATVRSVAPLAGLHYHNPVRSKNEIEQAIKKFKCKRFAVDHISELEKLQSLVSDPRTVEIAVRFAVSGSEHSVQNFGSKFGAKAEECAVLLKTAREFGFKIGLTFHPGSQTLDPLPYENCIRLAARYAAESKVNLDFLNVGGGFPSRYAAGKPADLTSFFTAIEKALCLFSKLKKMIA